MSGGLWRDHPATPRQAQLSFKSSRKRARPNQADVLIAMLRDARTNGRAVELPAIMAVGVAQHSARFNELRSRGFVIRNETEQSDDCRTLSPYYLQHDPERDSSL